MPDDLSRRKILGVFLSNYRAITRRVAARLGSPADAEDVLQESWFKLQRLGDASHVAHPASFVHSVVNNVANDFLRAHSTRVRYETAPEMETQSRHAPSTEQVYDYAQRLRRLQRVIASLPPRQRQAFTLHKFDGLSHSEVAAEMGISRSAVEKLVMKSLQRCRDELAGDLQED
ncbi:RNA polymerase sigma factor [Thioclava sp. GXIMD4216]|uniref:RNA polymerase sigma factor n=1 Tax=Thioclava sp. GXIMD4216 TaxID=3131929 RepID=UPI0030CCA532